MRRTVTTVVGLVAIVVPSLWWSTGSASAADKAVGVSVQPFRWTPLPGGGGDMISEHGPGTATTSNGRDDVGSLPSGRYYLPLDGDDRFAGEFWDDYDVTDQGGHYQIDGLQAGDYRLWFRALVGSFRTEYWDNQVLESDAVLIPVAAGQTIGGKDARIASASHITGTVSDDRERRVPGVQVTAFPISPTPGDPRGVSTDATGRYDLGGLRPGRYKLRFEDEYDVLATEWWDDQPTARTATVVVVGAGQSVGRSAVLAADPNPPDRAHISPPTILGTPAVRMRIRAANYRFTPPDATITFQWFADLDPIPGATRPSYVPTPADVGKHLRVRATAAKPGFGSASELSGFTGPVTS